MIHHHRSFFPVVLGLLTISLVALMVGAFWKQPASQVNTEETATPVVTEQAYRESAREIVQKFRADFTLAQTDAEKSAAVNVAYNALLALTVPGDYRELHFGLVTSLYLMRDGLAGDTQAWDTGWQQWNTLLSDNPWLT